MAFVTYENRANPHVTLHVGGCKQIRKRGGQHKYNQGGYVQHGTLGEAQRHAASTGLPLIICSFCSPQG